MPRDPSSKDSEKESMKGMSMTRRAWSHYLLKGAGAGFLCLCMADPLLFAAGPSSVPQEVQNLYAKKDYQKHSMRLRS